MPVVADNLTIKSPNLKLRAVGGVLDEMDEEKHKALLEYLVSRLTYGNQNRATRLRRYARIDRIISTHQKLSKDDTKREVLEDVTGRNQPIAMNLPLISAHVEDTVSFFAEVFAPQRKDFFVVPDGDSGPASMELAKKMNRDTRSRGYYMEVCKAIRALVKYNIGGLAVRWENGNGVGELAIEGNRLEAIDMYNYLYDPSVTDVAKLSVEGEWAARISVKNQMWVERKALKGELQRVDRILEKTKRAERESQQLRRNSTGKSAKFYKTPPSHVGLSMDASDERTSSTAQTVDWESYGAGLEGDNLPEIMGFEVIEMYCWLNPWEFDLVTGVQPRSQDENTGPDGLDANGEGYQLWRFILLDSCEVCFAEPVTVPGDSEPQIPHYLAFMTQDDMKEAQRSIAEMLRPFQRFGSFLMNIYVAGARKNIWGFKGVDPQMFDTSQFEHGETAGWLKSKTPGRDVRTGLIEIGGNTGVQESMEMLGKVLEVMRTLYPSQALPSQIASIERAVKNQVSAVMQGVHRRLHMTARILDAGMFSPLRMECYRNLARGDSQGLDGLNEEIVAKILGSGLQSLNAEAVAGELREIIFAIIQNQEAMQTFNVGGLFTFWSQLMNLPTDLGTFVRQQPQQAGGLPQPAASNPGAGGAL